MYNSPQSPEPYPPRRQDYVPRHSEPQQGQPPDPRYGQNDWSPQHSYGPPQTLQPPTQPPPQQQPPASSRKKENRLSKGDLKAIALLGMVSIGAMILWSVLTWHGNSAGTASSNQQPSTQPSTQAAPSGLKAAGALETGCKIIYDSDGLPYGATVTLYNPGSSPVSTSQIGIQWISNGIAFNTTSAPYQSVVSPGQVVTQSFSLDTATPATSCQAGWD